MMVLINNVSVVALRTILTKILMYNVYAFLVLSVCFPFNVRSLYGPCCLN